MLQAGAAPVADVFEEVWRGIRQTVKTPKNPSAYARSMLTSGSLTPPTIDRAVLVAWLRGACNNNTWPPTHWAMLREIAKQVERGDELR